MWWIKFTGAVAMFVVSCAGAAKILGVTIDLQTKTESRIQHEAIRQEIKDDQAEIIKRLEVKMDRLGERIDMAMAAMSHGRRDAKEQQP